MTKIKHTKNELKRQKDELKRFMRYLPTLVLKKQQLQLEIIKTSRDMEEVGKSVEELHASVGKWVAVFGEEEGLEKLVSVSRVRVKTENIAGIDLPVFEGVDFVGHGYDLTSTPVWIDFGIEAVERMITLRFRHQVLSRKRSLLSEELRITTQRVNLFEKIKIPESRENIRRINIVLGDMQTASVVTGKIAKRKIQEKYASA